MVHLHAAPAVARRNARLDQNAGDSARVCKPEESVFGGRPVEIYVRRIGGQNPEQGVTGVERLELNRVGPVGPDDADLRGQAVGTGGIKCQANITEPREEIVPLQAAAVDYAIVRID